MSYVTEAYGSYASIERSEANKGVSVESNVYFFGSAPGGTVGKVYSIESYADAVAKLAITSSDNAYTLAQAAKAAFQIVGISHAYFIVLSNTAAYSSAWIGDAGAETGIYVYNKILRESPGVVNLLCAPGVSDTTFLTALVGLCSNQNGIKSYAVADMPISSSDFASGFPDPDEIIPNKPITSEYASVVWGNLLAGEDIISGAAVRTCLLAKADAEYNCPARVGGYMEVSNVQSLVYDNAGTATKFDIRESEANVLSASGVCTYMNKYSHLISYGDHTSIYSNGTVTDERARWESGIRLLAMCANWFILTYAFIIDQPLTLQLRNDILTGTQRFLDGLVAVGGLIGDPRVEFIPAENPANDIARGNFVFSIKVTTPACIKVLRAKVQYSDKGLSVYSMEG